MLGGFPILFVLALRWTWGKETFDLAAAAINWSMYLNVLLLSGFALVPPAVARLVSGDGDVTRREKDLHAIGDHIVLSRWLVAIGVAVALVLAATVDRTFPELARMRGQELRWWFLMFAIVALAQIPMTLWLGIAQGLGHYRRGLVLVAAPRAAALFALLVGHWLGWPPGPVVALALLVVLGGQWLIGAGTRRALLQIDRRMLNGTARASRVLPANLNAGLVVLVGTAVTIVPVTLVGRWIPEQVGAAHVIVSFANALAAVVVAAFFPASLALHESLRRVDGARRYTLRVAGQAALFALCATVLTAGAGVVCNWTTGACQTAAIVTATLVLAGVGLRLGALGTQHIALFQNRPHLNLLSASAEALAAVALLSVLIPGIGLSGVGLALLIGGVVRLALSIFIEARWLSQPSIV